MAEDAVTRKLAAIVSADVVGYSRLMAADEEATLAAMREHREQFVDTMLARHGGRIVKLMGDGMLVEFASVVEAVRAFSKIQAEVAARNVAVAEDRRLEYRVGINQGEVVIEGDDIYGDGVNIAARLQEIAEPGGISVSDRVHGDVRGKIEIGFEDLGEVALKNIPDPVRVYRVLPEGETATPGRPARGRRRKPWPTIAAAVVACAIVAGGALWWLKPWVPEATPRPTDRATVTLPDKPSIAVLPFDNLSDDRSQQYFADGMSEDIITDLSKISGLFVIARNSSFAYRGKSADLRALGRELGVRYVLEGSVRRIGEQVRINAQLIDTQTGGHLWAERYNGAVTEIFELQDKVTNNIVSALAVTLTAEEAARAAESETRSAAAHDAFLEGWSHYIQTTPADYRKAVPLLEKAIARDPDYARAHAALAALYMSVRDKNWNQQLGLTPDGAIERAFGHLDRALEKPTPLAHQVRSSVLLDYRKYDQAIAEADKAITLDGNNPAGYVAKAYALVLAGEPRAAVPQVERAMRLDPNYPADDLYVLGVAHFGLQEYAEAAAALERARRLAPDHPDVLSYLVATFGYLDRTQEARSFIDKLRKLAESRVDTPWQKKISVAEVPYRPYRAPRDIEHFQEGLRRGGLPEFVAEWQFDRRNRLNGNELRRISFGRTHKGTHPKSKLPYVITRTAEGRFTAEGLWNDTGQSRIIGDRLCNLSDAYQTETCAVVYRNPDGSAPDGDAFILVLRSGAYSLAVQE